MSILTKGMGRGATLLTKGLGPWSKLIKDSIARIVQAMRVISPRIVGEASKRRDL